MMILPISARICLCATRKDSSMATSDSATGAVMFGSVVEGKSILPGQRREIAGASGLLDQMGIRSLYQSTRQVLMINERLISGGCLHFCPLWMGKTMAEVKALVTAGASGLR